MRASRQKKPARLFNDHRHLLTRTPGRSGMLVQNPLPARVWVELALGLTSSALLVLALLSPHWMELLFGLAPDAGDGSAEYGLALVWAAVSLLMFGLAGYTWKKQIRTSSIPLTVQR